MSDAEDALRRWEAAGLIDAATAARIRAFEAERRQPAAAPRPTSERPGLVEVLLYLGIAVLAVGVFALVAQGWPELTSAARLIIVGVPALVTLGAGALMRASGEPGIRRGGQLAWFVAVPLLAGTLAVYLVEYEPARYSTDDERAILLTVAAASVAIALLLWVAQPSVLQVVALGGATYFLAMAIGAWPDEFSSRLAGVTMVLAAAGALFLAEANFLTPRDAARLVFGLAGAFGSYMPGFSDGGTPWELLAFAVAGALLALGIRRASFLYVLCGVGLLFLALVRTIFQNFSDQVGAPVALIISGALLIAAVLLLARLAPRLRQGSPA